MQLDLFSKYQVASNLTTKAVKETEYGELLKQFQEQINMSRLGTNYKPVSIAKIGMDVAHLIKIREDGTKDYSDIYYLLSVCKDAGKRAKRYDSGFSKMFYWSIKPQPPCTN